jgi:hypothetical protein
MQSEKRKDIIYQHRASFKETKKHRSIIGSGYSRKTTMEVRRIAK